MASAEIFTTCHYCELPAATKHRVLVRDHRLGRRKVRHIYTCVVHEREAQREAAMYRTGASA